jgi:predicted DsbA family dithiol-disulfide isomerase
VEVRWRSFQLDPSAPAVAPADVDYVGRLARKYGAPRAHAQRMIDDMVRTGAAEGIAFRFDRARAGNTFDAHRLLHAAAAAGLQGALKERLLRAHFEEGVAVGDPEQLIALAAEAGMDAERARAALADRALADAVAHDLQRARELGITGVPFFLFAERFAVAGAQPAQTLAMALTRSWERAGLAEPSTPAATCAPDGCDVPLSRDADAAS